MAAPEGRRHDYLTSSRHQLDERSLLLRGGRLDGRQISAVAGVGQRLFCGEGAWSAEEVYVVTGETVGQDGLELSVAVPAFA